MEKQNIQERAKNNTAKSRYIVIALLVIVVISNTPPAQFFLLENYGYRNQDASFTYTEEPGKALDFIVCERRWEHFKAENPENSNWTLYRTFTIKPWQFWEWWQYIAHTKRFTLPYKSMEKK